MSTGNPLSSSLTDMMTSLMVIFILLLVNFLRVEREEKETITNQVRAITSTVEQLQGAMRSMVGELGRNVITGTRVELEDRLTLVVIVPSEEKELFEIQKDRPTQHFQAFLETFAPRFVELLARPEWRADIRSVMVEGHTDVHPYDDQQEGKGFGNLRLSQDRARKVFQILLEKAPSDDLRSFLWSMTTASGRADRECKCRSDENECNRRCRMVKFKVRVRSLQEREAGKEGIESELKDLPIEISEAVSGA